MSHRRTDRLPPTGASSRAPLVAIVGAPNVGKSTLFNRLIGRRQAIVTDEAGVTRDRQYGEVVDLPTPFRVVDTGGLTPNTAAPFVEEIARQADAALDEAAVVLFDVDARAGLSALDREIGELLRRRGVPLIVVANKVDAGSVEPLALELHELGLGDPCAVSAEHGRNLDELLDRVDDLLQVSDEPTGSAPAEQAAPVRVAIVGRPNVGKSSLLNRLLGEDRVMVSDVPGTTRDSIDTLLEIDGRRYLLIDTAGIRRRGKLQLDAERYSVLRAREAIERCEIAVLVLDGSEPFTAQDAHIAGYVKDAFRPMLVAVNKWDLVEEREEAAKRWRDDVEYRLRFVKEAPILLISALTGQRVTRVLERVDELYEAAGRRVSTPQLNRWLQRYAPPGRSTAGRGSAVRFFYATQTGVHPPRFVVFCSDPSAVHFSLRRRLENGLRVDLGFGPAPVRLSFRARREGRGR